MTGQNLYLNSTRPGPAPSPVSRTLSYNIHEPHEYAMFSLWGGGLTFSAFLCPSLDYQEKQQLGEEGKRGPQMCSQMRGEGERVADRRPQSPRCRVGGEVTQ